MAVQCIEKYWVLVLEPSENNSWFSKDRKRLFWGSKSGNARWTDDIAQATHFKSIAAARGKMAGSKAKNRSYVWQGVHKDDHLYVGEAESVVTVTELQPAE